MPQDSDPVGGVSILLAEIHSGNEAAREQLFQVIYDRLHSIARGQMRQERVDHTLGATALVNEACMRLDGVVDTVENKRELFGAASAAMRRVLVGYQVLRGAYDLAMTSLRTSSLHSKPSMLDLFRLGKSHSIARNAPGPVYPIAIIRDRVRENNSAGKL